MNGLKYDFMPEHDLFDILKDEFDLRSDSKLAEFLDIPKPALSKMRHGTMKISALHILRIYDATGWSIEKIRGYLPGSSVETEE